ncbi:hypothetical protein ACIOGZ_28585 [Kitasatospora sp. NPDC088160]|uniref:hypothetical protein n=1 Tax=Kitasatospora sp. NPDC088160 TaxID=3364072 RepID=UPI003820A90C
MTPAKHFPPELHDWVAGHLPGLAASEDRSWPRSNSLVWHVRGDWDAYVKISPNDLDFEREVAGYAYAEAHLTDQEAPRLLACDPHLRTILSSPLPGRVVRDLPLETSTELRLHEDAGRLLRRWHDASEPGTDADRAAVRSDMQDKAQEAAFRRYFAETRNPGTSSPPHAVRQLPTGPDRRPPSLLARRQHRLQPDPLPRRPAAALLPSRRHPRTGRATARPARSGRAWPRLPLAGAASAVRACSAASSHAVPDSRALATEATRTWWVEGKFLMLSSSVHRRGESLVTATFAPTCWAAGGPADPRRRLTRTPTPGTRRIRRWAAQ